MPEALRQLIDISGAQGPIDWEQAKAAGVEGAIVKLTEGASRESPSWMTHSLAVYQAASELGAYHFGRPDLPAGADPIQDAIGEAAFFLEHVDELAARGIVQSIRPALDLEKGKGSLTDENLVRWALTFCEEVCAAFDLSGMLIYANRSYIRHLATGAASLGRNEELAAHGLWIVHPDSPAVPVEAHEIWPEASLWQRGDEDVSWCPDPVLFDDVLISSNVTISSATICAEEFRAISRLCRRAARHYEAIAKCLESGGKCR